MSELTRREQLETLSFAAAYVVGAHPQCITGVALLVELAKRYGIVLTPRAVGLAGQSSFAILASGTAAKEHLVANGMTLGEFHRLNGEEGWAEDSAFRNSGHMIALDEESALLMDPSFEQFCEAGFPNTVIVTPVDLNEDEWWLKVSEDAFVVYLPKGDLGGWESDYERARAAVRDLVDELVGHLEAGGSPHKHSVRLDWDGAIPV